MLNLNMKKAFTLVELLVVISIMAILTIVTVSQFRTARKRANDVARKGDLNSVAKALQLYFADYGVLPESENGMISIGGHKIEWGGEFKDDTGYVYMIKLPQENKTGDWPEYCYKTDSTRKKYALFARLEVESDSECENNEYDCGGVSMDYCYANVSPNTSIGECGNFPEEPCIRAENTPTPAPTTAPTAAPTNTPTPLPTVFQAEPSHYLPPTGFQIIEPIISGFEEM